MIPGGWRRVLRAPRPAERQAREDVDAEIAFHLDRRTEELISSGLSPKEARERAEREFGDADRARDELVPRAHRHERRTRLSAGLDELRGDVRYGLRALRASPRFAAAAILTLGLAIGATATVFSVVNAVLLRPLPVRSPDRLALLWTATPDGESRGRPDYRTAEAWRRHARSFEDMALLDPVTATLTGSDGAEKVSAARISANFFRVLGVDIARGRGFTPDEAERGERLALVSHGFWRERHAASAVVGGTIELDGRRSRIIGVLPEDFGVPGFEAEVWEPYSMFPDWAATGNEGAWYVVGRLRPGVTVERARTEMDRIAASLAPTRPVAEREQGVSVTPLTRVVVGPRSRRALWVLSGAVLCVLLIAGANVTNLSLARGIDRAREFAVRASLGAGPGRIARQLLVENLVLAGASATVGVALAVAGLALVRVLGPGDLARLDQASLDPTTLAWTLAVSMLAGTLVGLAPAWTAVRRPLRPARDGGGRGTSDGVATRRLRRGLVVAEFALALVLLVGAGLLIRSWQSITGVDPGFTPDGLLSLNLSTTGYPTDAGRVAFYAAVLERVEALPGVERAGTIGDLFTDGDIEATVTVSDEPTSARVRLRIDEVSDDLFATLEAPLLRGRSFTAADGPGAPAVAIVNRRMATRLWGRGDPIGRRIRIGPRESDAPWLAIVGVVGDMRRQGLDIEPIPQLFVPLAQRPSGSEILLVRTTAEDPLDAVAAVRAAVRDVDGGVPVYSVTSVPDQLGADLGQRRFQTSLLLGFSLVALLMACIGIYGVIRHSVARRLHEFAIRMTVGARTRDILSIAMREGLALVLTGLGLGLLGALWAERALAGLLYGVAPTDPVTFAAVSLLLAGVALVAAYLPARRATGVDPLIILRHD